MSDISTNARAPRAEFNDLRPQYLPNQSSGLFASFKSHLPTMQILIATELRLRARRWTSVFAIFLMVVISWNIISDPATGISMMVINQRRTLYTSSALALGSACLFGMIMLFAGFYLLRGRVAEDVRTGIGSLIGASPVPNWVFLLSRWIGGVVYFLILIYTGMCTVMVLQAVRGEPGIELWPYLQTYTLVYVPLAFYVASIAILFDSVPWLMGKLGDLLYFILWIAQMSLLTKVINPSGALGELLFVFDFTGLMTSILNVQTFAHTSNFSLGGSSFNAALEPLRLPNDLWNFKLSLMRLGSAIMALLPLGLGILCFHRYSADKVKASQTRRRRNPIQILNDWTRPLAVVAKPLMSMSVYLPNALGQVVAEVALSLISAPVFILVLIALNVLSVTTELPKLMHVQAVIVIAWGVLIADISTRDFQAGTESLTGVARGGSGRRTLRHLLACALLALLFGGVSMVRMSQSASYFVMVMLLGFVAIGAFATVLGSMTRHARPFIAVFLFWSYIASQASKVAIIDLFGFNHAATNSTIQFLLILGASSLALLVGHQIWKQRQ